MAIEDRQCKCGNTTYTIASHHVLLTICIEAVIEKRGAIAGQALLKGSFPFDNYVLQCRGTLGDSKIALVKSKITIGYSHRSCATVRRGSLYVTHGFYQ